MIQEGKFIVFEGLDRSGKTTIVNELYERLVSNFPVKKIRFPNRDDQLGKLVDGYLRKQVKFEDETIHLLFSGDRYEHRLMINEIRKNNIILCDRYSMSGIVYSAAKGLDLNWCIMVESLLPKPDLTIFIDTPMEELIKRKGFGDEVYDNKIFQEKTYALYQELLKNEKNSFIVDGSLPINEIIEIIIKRIFE